MSLTIKLSGTYCDPTGQPLPFTTVKFEAQQNSNQTYIALTSQMVTDSDGNYSIELVPNMYLVSTGSRSGESILGFITINPDSPDGTLNEYLTSFVPDSYTPGILKEMEEILEETKEIAGDAGINPCGHYDSSITYQKNDLVEFEGSQYRATTEILNITPPSEPWELFVSAGVDGKDGTDGKNGVDGEDGVNGTNGVDGKDGKDGAPGPANILSIGTVTTLEPDQQATASIEGTSPQQTLSLGIPKGKDGKDGVDGEDGADGTPGPANTLTIGTVETVAPDVPASATITGDAPNQTLNLSIPQGKEGTSIVVPEFEAPGFIGFFAISTASTTAFIHPGDEFPASQLAYTAVSDPSSILLQRYNSPSGGTWRSAGFATYQSQVASYAATVFQRVDVIDTARSGRQLAISDCIFSKEDQSMIDCLITIGDKSRPFSACKNDAMPWGREIYQNALSGMYGEIQPYVPPDTP